MANVITVATYVIIAQDYAHSIQSLTSPVTFLTDATQTVANLDDILPTVDLIGPLFTAQTGTTTITMVSTIHNGQIPIPTFPTSWIAACRACNNHVITRGGYADVNAFLASVTSGNQVPPQWLELCKAAGFTNINATLYEDPNPIWGA